MESFLYCIFVLLWCVEGSFTFYSVWRFTPIPILNLYQQMFCNIFSKYVENKSCTLKRGKVWHQCPGRDSVAQIQWFAIQNWACFRNVTATALSSTIKGSVLRKFLLSNFPHSTLNISVLLLHVNWLQLKFTYTRGYNGVFLTAFHFTELLTFAILFKVHPRTGYEGPEGEWRYISTFSLTSTLDVGGWSTPCPGRFISG
jgi:hypothetical protein